MLCAKMKKDGLHNEWFLPEMQRNILGLDIIIANWYIRNDMINDSTSCGKWQFVIISLGDY